MRARRRRWAGAAAACGLALLTGCTGGASVPSRKGPPPGGQPVDVVLQTTRTPSGPTWLPVDMAVSGSLTLRLLTVTLARHDRTVLWTVRDGRARHVAVDLPEPRVSQLAVDPAGTAYVAAGHAVWHLAEDGSAVRVVGSGAAGWSPDGTPAAGAALGSLAGLAIGPDGTFYLGEVIDQPLPGCTLVRSVVDGRLTTLMGRFPPAGPFGALVRDSYDPPPGTAATSIVLCSGVDQERLAAGRDGTVYQQRSERVLARLPDGTVRAVVAGRSPRALEPVRRPFADRGAAVDARLVQPTAGGLAADPTDGMLYLVDGLYSDFAVNRAGERPPGGAFRWLPPVAAYDPDYEVWQVTPAGRLRTASYGGRVIAAQDGWLYVAGERPVGGEVVVVRVDASAAGP